MHPEPFRICVCLGSVVFCGFFFFCALLNNRSVASSIHPLVAHVDLSKFLVFEFAMQRTTVLLRNAKGYGWYKQFKEAPEAFNRFTMPTPFDWSKDNIVRPKASFSVSCGGEDWGNLVFELAQDVMPKTVENFKLLTTGNNQNKFTYKGTKFHRIRKGEAIMGGDVEMLSGEGSHSAYASRYLADENFIIPHSGRGLLRYSFDALLFYAFDCYNPMKLICCLHLL